MGECDHDEQVCQSCFRAHLRYEICEAGRVLHIRCPCTERDGAPCSVVVKESTIRDVLTSSGDNEVWERYERLKNLQSDEHARECPQCHHVEHGSPDAPIMTCGQCTKRFCFLHDVAHEPTEEACREYIRQNLQSEQQAAALMNSSAARCPSCNTPIYKHAGCNHISCRCGTEFCWLCGLDITGQVMWHYHRSNPCGCPGMMMTADQAPNSRREVVLRAIEEQKTCAGRTKTFLKGWFSLLILFPFVVAFAAVGIAFGLCCCIVCIPCACIVVAQEDNDTGPEVFLMLMLLPIVPIVYVVLYLRACMYMICCCGVPVSPTTDQRVPRFGNLGGHGVIDGAGAPTGAGTGKADNAV